MNEFPKEFLLNRGDFFKDLDVLANKYGLKTWFCCISDPVDAESSEWSARSNAITDGLLDCLEDTIEDMRGRLDQYGTEHRTS